MGIYLLRKIHCKIVLSLCLVIVCLGIISGSLCSASHQGETKRVLIMPSYNFDYLGSKWFLQGVIDEFQANGSYRISYSHENLQLAAHSLNEQYYRDMAESLKIKYSKEKPDLIIVQYKQALEFMLHYGESIFGDIPVIFAGLEIEDYSKMKLPVNYTGVIASFYAERNIDLISQNHPDVKQIYIVAGVSSSERAMMEKALQQGAALRAKVELIPLNELPYEKMLEKIDTIKDHAAIMYLSMQMDVEGKVFVPAAVAREISQVSHIPIYGMLDTYMGSGITGGFLINHSDMGKRVAKIGEIMLHSKEMMQIPVANEPIGEYTFDWRELERWKVNEAKLPADSQIDFKEVSLWQLYKWQFIGGICLLVLQGFFIIGLLKNRSIRIRTEKRLRKSEERFKEIMDKLPVAVASTDRNHNIVFTNAKFIEFFGYSLADVPSVFAWMEKAYPNEEYRKKASWQWANDIAEYAKQITSKPPVRDYHITCNDGTTKEIEITFALDEDYEYIVFDDITERKQAEKELQQKNNEIQRMAYFDLLTGLPNRACLNKRLQEEMIDERYSESGVVLVIDLDDLKIVNDTFGHAYGDAIIIAAGNRIVSEVGKCAFVARIGGDAFSVILPGRMDQRSIKHMATRVIEAIGQEYLVREVHFSISASAGIAIYPNDGSTAEEIIKNADNAMYTAKKSGKNRWLFYETSMQVDAYEKIRLTNSLRHAIDRGELTLHYQPQIIIERGDIAGFEALLRWNSFEHGSVSPARFIPLAEQSGLIERIGIWVLREACQFARKLSDQGWGDLHVGVNVSPYQLSSDDFTENVRMILAEAGIKPQQIELEITESVLIASLEEGIRKIEELQAMGVGLALDDFGTGYSSLTYLQRLPVQTLKIDKSFIDLIMLDEKQPAIIGAIIDMAHIMGMIVVAEGAEHKQQMTYLANCRCDRMQGYYISRPVPEDDAINFLRIKKCPSNN